MIVTVSRSVSMGHRLPSYNGLCASLHGHNIRIHVTARVKEGFLDFKSIDKWLEYVLSSLDHAMVLSANDPLVPILREAIVNPTSRETQRLVLLNVEPTTEALAQLIMNEMSTYCYVESVTVHETDKYEATCTEISNDVRRIAEKSQEVQTA